MPFSHPIHCHPLLFLPSVFPSIKVFSNESVLRIRWPKYWSFSISLSSEYSGLVSFRMDWLDLLAVQRTLKSLLQHHSSKASILCFSAFFSSILTSIHDHWKTIALTRRTFVGKVMSALLDSNMLSNCVYTDQVFPRLISFRMVWLDLLAVQRTLKSLLQHHSSKASILQHSAFFTVQLSHPYMTTGKAIALTRRTFVAK